MFWPFLGSPRLQREELLIQNHERIQEISEESHAQKQDDKSDMVRSMFCLASRLFALPRILGWALLSPPFLVVGGGWSLSVMIACLRGKSIAKIFLVIVLGSIERKLNENSMSCNLGMPLDFV